MAGPQRAGGGEGSWASELLVLRLLRRSLPDTISGMFLLISSPI